MQNHLHEGETFFGDECVAVGSLEFADGVQCGHQLAEALQHVHVGEGQQLLAHHEDCLLRKRGIKKSLNNEQKSSNYFKQRVGLVISRELDVRDGLVVLLAAEE